MSHHGSLQIADTKWGFVLCSCGWKSARSLNSHDYSWTQHTAHVEFERQVVLLQNEIHGRRDAL